VTIPSHAGRAPMPRKGRVAMAGAAGEAAASLARACLPGA
jgi:hypothetical protein